MSGERDAFGNPVPEAASEDSASWLPPQAPGREHKPQEPAWGPPSNSRSSQWARPAGSSEPSAAVDRSVMELAGFGQRAGAAAIDFLIRLAIAAVGAGLGAILFVAGTDAGVTGLIAGGATGAVLGTLLYAPTMMARTNGQTVGHRATGTRIVTTDGSPMSWGRAFVREVLVKSVLMEGIGGFVLYALTLVNYLMPLWDKGNQALHDKICGTRVVQD